MSSTTKALSESEKIELAKAYVALSNAHKLDLILPMFADGASYHSPHVGVFDGRPAIRDMMSGFFSRFPDVYWTAGDYQCTKGGGVRFNFVMTATEVETGEKIRRTGAEELEFSDDGLISRLEVHKR